MSLSFAKKNQSAKASNPKPFLSRFGETLAFSVFLCSLNSNLGSLQRTTPQSYNDESRQKPLCVLSHQRFTAFSSITTLKTV